MSTAMLIMCVVSVIVIERNTVVTFSLKIVSLIVVVNVGFALNQVFSMYDPPHTILSKIMQAVAFLMVTQYISLGLVFTSRQWRLFKKY